MEKLQILRPRSIKHVFIDTNSFVAIRRKAFVKKLEAKEACIVLPYKLYNRIENG